MSLNVKCPSCRKTLKVKDTLAGKTIRCPACQAPCRIPADTPTAAPQLPRATSEAPMAAEARSGADGNSPVIGVESPRPEVARLQPQGHGQQTDRPGNQIGRFQIRSALGQGGFGTVYRAYDPILDREVALKVPRVSSPSGERLILEARAAAPLRHPNIVAVYEAGADGDELFIAAEYVEGQTLTERISGKAIDPSLAAEWAKSLAEALQYAHHEGVVHRDVKPQNIMIGPTDRAQLMDFGLAVSQSQQAGTGVGAAADSEVAGTPAYMSPEQARGDSTGTGPASDQYSLGAVLYELLTGKPPFRGGPDVVATVAAETKPPAPRSLVLTIPRDLEAICLKAMTPQPGRRYASCRALSEDLGRFLNGELVRARWYSPLELAVYWAKKRPALFGWATAAVCLLALLIGGGLAMGVRSLRAGEDQSVTGTGGTQGESVSTRSTSTNIDVVSDLDSETLLYGRQLDRTRMAFEQDDVIQADRVLEQSRWDFRNWEYNYLRRIVNGGWKTLHGHWNEITAITIHPDGKHFASAGYDNNIRIWEIASGEPVQVLNCHRLVTSLAYSPDGSLLAVATGNSSDRPTRPEYGIYQEAMRASPAMMAPPAPGSSTPAPAPVDTPAPPAPVDAPTPPDAPAVAMAVFAQPGPVEHAVILLDSQTLEQVALYSEHSGPIASIAFSSDGQLIASGGSDMSPAGPVPAGQGVAPAVGSVRIWNVKTLKTERELASPSGPIRRLAFIPGSQRIAATTGKQSFGSVLIWNLDPNAPSGGMLAPPAVMPAAPVVEPAPPAAASTVFTDVVIPVALRLASDESGPIPEASPIPADVIPSAPVAEQAPQPAQAAPIVAEPTPRPVDTGPTVNEAVPQPPLSDAPTELLTQNSGPLMPEQQFPAGSFALAVSGANGGRIVAAPAMDLSLLEEARRRISGTRGVVHDWMMTGGPESTDIHGSPSAVFDMAFSGEPNAYGSQSLAVAGGDPLQIHRPGLLTLHNPAYEYGTQVKHRGHRSALTAVAFRADGKQFITGDANGTLKIWSAEVHPEVIRLPSQTVATRVAFGNDGRYVAVAGGSQAWNSNTPRGVPLRDPDGRPALPNPGSIQLHDIRNGNSVLTLTGGPGDVLGLAMDPQSKWIAGGGEDAHVRVWDLESGDVRYERKTPGVVRCIAVSPDGLMIAASCAAEDNRIKPVPETTSPGANTTVQSQGFVVVWQVSDGRELARWSAHDGDSLSVAFSPDGLQLASSGTDRTVKVWTLADQKLAATLDAFDGEIVDLSFRPSGKDLAGVGFDPCRPDKAGDVVVWNAADGHRRLTLPGMSGRMYGIAYSPDGRRMATGGGAFQGSLSSPGEVKVWDAETGIELLPLIGRPGRNEKIEQFTRTYDVQVTKTMTETLFRTVEVQVPTQITKSEKVPEKSIGDDGKEVTTYREEIKTSTEMHTETREVPYTVCRPETRTETKSQTHTMDVTWEEPGTVLGIAFSGDGRCLAAACEDGSALVWDAANCQPHDTASWRDGRLLCSSASPDGRLIATGGDMASGCECAGLIRIFDANTGRLTREIETAAGPVTGLAFMPDSQNLVSVGSCNGWPFPASCSVDSDPVPMSHGVANQFSAIPNTMDVRSHCEVWDVATGTRVIGIGEPEAYIAHIAVDPIDGHVLTAVDKTIRLHDRTSGTELRRWTINSYAESLTVAPNSQRFAVFDGDGAVLMANLDSDEPPKLVAEKLSHSRLTFDSDGKQLAAIETIWSPGQGVPVQYSQELPAPAVKFELVSKRQLHLWNVESPDTHRVLPLTSTHTPSAIAWDSKLKSFVIGGEDGSVVLVDPDDGSQSLRMTGHRDATRVLTLPDGRFASFGSENKLNVWRIAPAEKRNPDCVECTPPGAAIPVLPAAPHASPTPLLN